MMNCKSLIQSLNYTQKLLKIIKLVFLFLLLSSNINSQCVPPVITNTNAVTICTNNSPNITLTSDFGDPRLYFTTFTDASIRSVSLNGSNEQVFLSGLNVPSGIAIDNLNHKIYWTEWNGPNNIKRANLDGTSIEVLVGGGPYQNANEIALDTLNGKMYWTDWDNETIHRANLDGSNIQLLVSPPLAGLDVEGIALDIPSGKMYWGNRTGIIMRSNLDGTAIENIVTGLGDIRAVELDLINSKIYSTSTNGGNNVTRCNLDGSNVETIITGPPNTAWGLAINNASNKLYLSYFSTPVKSSNLDGTSLTTILSSTGTKGFMDLGIYNTYQWTIGTITGGITGAASGTGNIINQTLVNPGNLATGTVEYIVTATSLDGQCIGTPTSIIVSVITPNLINGGDIDDSANWELGCMPSIDLENGTDIIIDYDVTIPQAVTLNYKGDIIIEALKTVTNSGMLISNGGMLLNNGTYKGNGSFNGNFVNNGVVSPGN